ncbi:MAG: carboxypeptidase-like regulatory domain-containing protein, partial [Bryobacteraceae bacterium]
MRTYGKLSSNNEEVSMLRVRFALTIALLCCAPFSWAQQGKGTIVGAVTDASGAAVSDARVVITNTDTNVSVTAQTGASGNYTSPPLIVGNYQVSVEHAGFKKAVRTGISLQVDQHAAVNLQLELGTVGESVEVTAAAPLVNTEDATFGQVIENKRVEELPINGRSAFALI